MTGKHPAPLPARDQADELAGAMLARLLPGAQTFSARSLAAEALEKVGEGACKTICISAVPPQAASHASYLARRLKKRFPTLKAPPAEKIDTPVVADVPLPLVNVNFPRDPRGMMWTRASVRRYDGRIVRDEAVRA